MLVREMCDVWLTANAPPPSPKNYMNWHDDDDVEANEANEEWQLVVRIIFG